MQKGLLLGQPKRLPSARWYPPRDLLNCDGSNFSSDWYDFRRLATENARAGFPEDRDLYHLAISIVEPNQAIVLPNSMKFPQVLVRQIPVSRLNGFCLFGYATALFIIFRHELNPTQLLHIEQSLGWIEWPLDFMESSDWPTLWRIASLHLEHFKRRGDTSWSTALQTWGDDEQLIARPSLAAVEAALLAWLRDVGAPPQRWLLARAQSTSRRLGKIVETFRHADRSMGVWVLGHHLGSSLEPFTMLREALRGVPMQQEFCGQRHPRPGLACEEFGFCDRNEEIENWFRRYEMRWLGEYDWMPRRWDEALSNLALAVGRSAFKSRADLIICGGPAWLCAMLRSIGSWPMLLYFAWAIAPMVPEDFKSQVFTQIRSLGQTLTPPTVIVVANWVLAAQFALQTRLQVPVQRPHGIYTNHTYSPVPTPEGKPRIMVTRIGQWAKVSGVALLELVFGLQEAVRKETGLPDPFSFVFLSVRVRGINTNRALKYAEFATFYACVFWPWDVMMLLFDELYTMTVPLLIPERRWMYQIMLHSLLNTEVNWWHLRAETVRGALPHAQGPEERPFPLPYMPWIGGGDGLEQAAFWYELTDFAQFPHITTFGSLPDLVEKVAELDVPTIRRGMREFNRATLRESKEFYRKAAVELLS